MKREVIYGLRGILCVSPDVVKKIRTKPGLPAEKKRVPSVETGWRERILTVIQGIVEKNKGKVSQYSRA